MKNQKKKMVVVIICMLAACICYSCSRAGGNSVLEETLMDAAGDTAGDGAAIADETAAKMAAAEDTGRSGAMAGPAESSQEAKPVCYVHICGEVVSPGVYELEEGCRVFDAIEHAGGFTERAASEYLNLAETVADGNKIIVPAKDSLEGSQIYGEASSGGAKSGGSTAQPEKVNINTAGIEQLTTLTGVGQSRAEAIIQYREAHGKFERIEDIMKVSGIKDGAFQKIKDRITV